MIKTKDKEGKFIRTNQIWTPQNMNNGYIDHDGRYRVYLPIHSRAYPNGYVLRAIVHYEYYNNEQVTKEFDIHHKDENRLNDTKENLEKLSHLKHSELHHEPIFVEKSCKHCGKLFKILAWRLREKNTNRGSYCSLKCSYNRKRSEETKNKLSKSLKLKTWSREFKSCMKCGKTDHKHEGNGLCKYCYQIEYRKR